MLQDFITGKTEGQAGEYEIYNDMMVSMESPDNEITILLGRLPNARIIMSNKNYCDKTSEIIRLKLTGYYQYYFDLSATFTETATGPVLEIPEHLNTPPPYIYDTHLIHGFKAQILKQRTRDFTAVLNEAYKKLGIPDILLKPEYHKRHINHLIFSRDLLSQRLATADSQINILERINATR